MMELEATQEISLTDYKQSDEENNDGKQNIVAHLKVYAQKGLMEAVYPIYEGENLIGRDPDSCDIHLAAKALSKQHACIEVKDQNHLIYDKGSRNKTKKGKLYLKPDVRYNLEDGEQVFFADIKCTYTYMKTEVKSDDDSNLGESPQRISVNNNERQDDSICYELDEEEMSSDVIDSTQVANVLGSFCHPSQPTQLYVADSEPEENQSEPNNEISRYIPDSDDEPELGINCPEPTHNTAVTCETNQMPEKDPASSSVSKENDEGGPTKMSATTLPKLCKEAYNLDLCPTQTDDPTVEPAREQQVDVVPDSQSQIVTQTFDGNRHDEIDTDTQTFKDQMSDSQIVLDNLDDSTLGYDYNLEEDISEGAVIEQHVETSMVSSDAKVDQTEASTPDSEPFQSLSENTEGHKQSDVGQEITGDAVRSQVLEEKEATQIDKVDTQNSETGLTQLFEEEDDKQVYGEEDLTQICENEHDKQTGENKNMTEVCEEKGDTEVLTEGETVQVCENKLDTQVVTESETAHNLEENVDKMMSKEVQDVHVCKETEEKDIAGDDNLPKLPPPIDECDTQHLSDIVPQTQVTEELGSQTSPEADGILIVAETPSDTVIHASHTKMDPEPSPSRQHSLGNDPTKMSSEQCDTVLIINEDVDTSESQCDTAQNMDTNDVPTLYATSPATEINLNSPLRNSALDATQILDCTHSGVCVPSPVLRVTSPLSVPDRRRPSSPQDDLEETQILDASGNESSASSMPRSSRKRLAISVMNEERNEDANDELSDIYADFRTVQDNEESYQLANTQAYSEQVDDDTDTKEQSVNTKSEEDKERVATNEKASTTVCKNEKEEKASSTKEVSQTSEQMVEESLETTPVRYSHRQSRRKSKGTKIPGQGKTKGQKLTEPTTQAEEKDTPKQQKAKKNDNDLSENAGHRDEEESLGHGKDQSFDTEDDQMACNQAYGDDKDDSKHPVKGMKTKRRQSKLEQKTDADVHKAVNERSTRSSKNINLTSETEDVIQPESVTVQLTNRSESKGKFPTVEQRKARSQRLAKHTAQDLENDLAIQQETKNHDHVLLQQSSGIDHDQLASTQAYGEPMDDSSEHPVRGVKTRRSRAKLEQKTSRDVYGKENEKNAERSEKEKDKITPVRSSCRQTRKKGEGNKTAWQGKVKGQKLTEQTTQDETNDTLQDTGKQDDDNSSENYRHEYKAESMEHVKDQSFDVDDDQMASTQAYGEQMGDEKDGSEHPVRGMKTRRRQNKLEQKVAENAYKEREKEELPRTMPVRSNRRQALTKDKNSKMARPNKAKSPKITEQTTRAEGDKNSGYEDEKESPNPMKDQSFDVDDDQLASTQAYGEQIGDEKDGSEHPVRGMKTRRRQNKLEQKVAENAYKEREKEELPRTMPVRSNRRQALTKDKNSKMARPNKAKSPKITEQTTLAEGDKNSGYEDEKESPNPMKDQSFDVDDDQLASTQAYGEQIGDEKDGSEHPVRGMKTRRRQNKLEQKVAENAYKEREKEELPRTMPVRSNHRQALTKDKNSKMARPNKAKSPKITEQTTLAEGDKNSGYEDEKESPNPMKDQSFDVDDDQLASTQAYGEQIGDEKDGSEHLGRGMKTTRRQIKLEEIASQDVCEEKKEKKGRRLPKKVNKTPEKEHEQNSHAGIPVKIEPNKAGSKGKRFKIEKKVKRSVQGSDVHCIAYDEAANKDVAVVLEKINVSPEDTPVLVLDELSSEQQTPRSVKLTKLRLKKKNEDPEENGMSSEQSQVKYICVSGVRGSSQTMGNGGIAVIPEKQAWVKRASCVNVKVKNESPTAVTCFEQSSGNIKPDPDGCSDYGQTPPGKRSRKKPSVLGTVTDSKPSKKLADNVASQSPRTRQATNAIVKREVMEAEMDEYDFEPPAFSQVRRSLRKHPIKTDAFCPPTKRAKFDGSVKKTTQTDVSRTELHASVYGTIRRRQQNIKKSETKNLPGVPQEGDDELSGTSKPKPQQRSHQQKRPQKMKSEMSEIDGTAENKKQKLSSESTATPRRSSRTGSVGSPSLRRSTSESKPKIMFTGLSTKQAEKTVKILGGNLASCIQDCTHLVTDKVRRTMKFLCAVARGIPIVSPAWLDSCRTAGLFLDASSFLIVDKASEKTYKFSLASSLKAAAKRRLLTGYKIHVTKSVVPDAEQMKDIITCAGGEFLPSMPKKAGDKVIVISCPEDKALYKAAKGKRLTIVTAEFLLTGILQQVLDVKAYSL